MGKDTNMIKELVLQIENGLAGELDIVKLAEYAGISPWHFQRLFKSLVGDTLGRYVRGRRLTHAAGLLLNTQRDIIDIAFEVGFQSHEAFSRAFKAHFALSPTVFRTKSPAVLPGKKPLLSDSLLTHLQQDMALTPMLRNRPQQHLMGFKTSIPSPFVSPQRICDLLYPLWIQIMERQNEVKERVRDAYLGLSLSPSGDFTEDQLTYLACFPVSEVREIPKGMVTYTLSAQQEAVFKISVTEADTVSKTMDYIYGYWLPNSEYTRASGHDYEFFDAVGDENIRHSYYVLPI